MTKYRVVGKHIRVSASHVDDDDSHPTDDQQILEVGEVYDESELSEDVLRAFDDRFEEVVTVDDDDDSDLPDPAEYTVDEFEELLADGDYDDHLDELLELEQDGEGRNGIENAIEDRR